MDNFELLSWGSNFLSFLLFIYLLIGTIHSTCFSVVDTFLTLANLALSVSAQFISVIFKNKNNELE